MRVVSASVSTVRLGRENRRQIAARRAPALAAMDGQLIGPHALLGIAVEVGRIGMPGLLARLDQRLEHRMARLGVADLQRPIGAVEVVAAVLVRLRPLEIGQHVAEAPAFQAQLAPLVIVARMPADIDHAVHRRRSAQHLAARPVHAPVAQLRLAFGLVVPVEFGALRQQRADAGRHVDHQRLVARPGLQKQNLVLRIGRQPVRQNAARRARADDDVVESLGYRFRHGVACVSRDCFIRLGIIRPNGPVFPAGSPAGASAAPSRICAPSRHRQQSRP